MIIFDIFDYCAQIWIDGDAYAIMFQNKAALSKPSEFHDAVLELVHCKIQSFGYNRFNFTRASSVVNCQSTVVWRVLRSLFQKWAI